MTEPRVIHVTEGEPTVVLDPAIAAVIAAEIATFPPADPGTQRYFYCDDGDISYTVVARDLDHARELLLASGMEATNPDTGDSFPWKDATWLEWGEYTAPERIAKIRVHDDDRRGSGPDGKGWPIDTFRPGDWFCSEW